MTATSTTVAINKGARQRLLKIDGNRVDAVSICSGSSVTTVKVSNKTTMDGIARMKQVLDSLDEVLHPLFGLAPRARFQGQIVSSLQEYAQGELDAVASQLEIEGLAGEESGHLVVSAIDRVRRLRYTWTASAMHDAMLESLQRFIDHRDAAVVDGWADADLNAVADVAAGVSFAGNEAVQAPQAARHYPRDIQLQPSEETASTLTDNQEPPAPIVLPPIQQLTRPQPMNPRNRNVAVMNDLDELAIAEWNSDLATVHFSETTSDSSNAGTVGLHISGSTSGSGMGSHSVFQHSRSPARDQSGVETTEAADEEEVAEEDVEG